MTIDDPKLDLPDWIRATASSIDQGPSASVSNSSHDTLAMAQVPGAVRGVQSSVNESGKSSAGSYITPHANNPGEAGYGNCVIGVLYSGPV
jgi:hypothetical protein